MGLAACVLSEGGGDSSGTQQGLVSQDGLPVCTCHGVGHFFQGYSPLLTLPEPDLSYVSV